MKSIFACSRFSLLFVVLLTGCASPATVNLRFGLDNYKKGNYEKAFYQFVACAQAGNTSCINNAGAAAAQLGDTDVAAEWFTLGARVGDQQSIDWLRRSGYPVPYADIAEQKAQQQAENSRQLWQGIAQSLRVAACAMSDDVCRQQQGLPPRQKIHCTSTQPYSGAPVETHCEEQ